MHKNALLFFLVLVICLLTLPMSALAAAGADTTAAAAANMPASGTGSAAVPKEVPPPPPPLPVDPTPLPVDPTPPVTTPPAAGEQALVFGSATDATATEGENIDVWELPDPPFVEDPPEPAPEPPDEPYDYWIWASNTVADWGVGSPDEGAEPPSELTPGAAKSGIEATAAWHVEGRRSGADVPSPRALRPAEGADPVSEAGADPVSEAGAADPVRSPAVSPKTGDESPLVSWLLAAAGMGAAAFLLFRRRQHI